MNVSWKEVFRDAPPQFVLPDVVTGAGTAGKRAAVVAEVMDGEAKRRERTAISNFIVYV
jgi:hypothetical protein